MQDSAAVKEQIREWVADAAQRKGIESVKDDELITQNGVLDSLAIFRRIGDDEIVNTNFQSVDEIDRFVTRKLSAK
jgi:hypothetical protein